MKKFFNYFIYISIASLIITLFFADFLHVPAIYDYKFLILSILFVCLGFFLDAVAWKKTLNGYGFKEVNSKDSVISIGLSIFGKYIPGKLWLIVGRSAYIAKRYNLNEKDTTSISLNAQFISLWAGLLIGSLGLIFIGSQMIWVLLTLFFWIMLSLVLFSRIFHNFSSFLINKITKKLFIIPSLSVSKVIKVVPWYLLNWFIWCVGFYFLTQALSPSDANPFIGLSFALAGTLGLLAIFAPGGIGIREGILATMLIMTGLDEPLAISISVASRLWFLIGEGFIFALAIMLKSLNKVKK